MYWNGNGLYQREFEEFLKKESEYKELEQLRKLYVQTYFFSDSQFCAEECNEFISNCMNCSNNEICYHHIVTIPCKHSKKMEHRYVEKLMDNLILKMNNELKPLKKSKMSHIVSEVQKRMHMGRTKYGHGVRITDDMSNYTQNKQDSFLEMQLEEIVDGIIYTVAAYLRHICSLYKIELANGEDNNEDICNIITNGITFPDERSQRYKELLEGMIDVYNKTLVLKTI